MQRNMKANVEAERASVLNITYRNVDHPLFDTAYVAHVRVYAYTFHFGEAGKERLYVPGARYFLISRDRWHARSRYFFEIVGAGRDTCRRVLSRAHHKYLNSGSKKNYVFTAASTRQK